MVYSTSVSVCVWNGVSFGVTEVQRPTGLDSLEFLSPRDVVNARSHITVEGKCGRNRGARPSRPVSIFSGQKGVGTRICKSSLYFLTMKSANVSP